jgi:N,N-dimethylformamidase
VRVVGYADTFSVESGGTIKFMVSSEASRYRADIVRLIHGDTNPAGPGFKSERVPSSLSDEYEGRPQRILAGSYIRVPHQPHLNLPGDFTIEAWIWPTTPTKERQALVSKRGAFELSLSAGRLELHVGVWAASLEKPVEMRTWYFVSASVNSEAREARLSLEPLEPTARSLAASATVSLSGTPSDIPGDLLIAATEGMDGPTDFYNGKIEGVRIATSSGTVASWDFSADLSSRHVRDVSGNGLHGRTVNMPMRGATGHNFTGREVDWRHAPDEYGAIHFHDDDLDDAGWEVDFEWTIPAGIRSGVYAVHLQAEGEEDYIPFCVRPKLGRRTARILFVVPLFSYLAYGNTNPLHSARENARRSGGAGPELSEMWRRMFPDTEIGASVRDYPQTPQDCYIADNRLLSLYDVHGDGSPVCYSSRLRPLVNMRPKYWFFHLDFGDGSPHQFNADLHLVDWLHEFGYEFDVITDEDLHLEGAALLEPYSVVLTGTHSEYWSGDMLDAAAQYLAGGGRLMYLGGNGFYYVAQLDPEERHTVEVRRSLPPPMPAHTHAPGENHFSTTGELGGRWAERGRAPQRLVGVGFIADTIGPGRPYERQPGSNDPRVAFIFEGIGERELIGDFPCLVNGHGAAGYEMDVIDHSLGSPLDTILLATAAGFEGRSGVIGTGNEPVRADMVYLEYPNGGAVFSPGSISWCGSLSYNGYDNSVSRITRHVLDRFASPERSAPSGVAGSRATGENA